MDDFMDQGAFAGSADSGYGDQTAEGYPRMEILQVMAGGSADFQPRMLLFGAGTPFGRNRDRGFSG